MATHMGIVTPVSTNPAMIIGGLKVGVSPLEMAHAYETLAEGGQPRLQPGARVPPQGPIGIAKIVCPQRQVPRQEQLVAKPISSG